MFLQIDIMLVFICFQTSLWWEWYSLNNHTVHSDWGSETFSFHLSLTLFFSMKTCDDLSQALSCVNTGAVNFKYEQPLIQLLSSMGNILSSHQASPHTNVNNCYLFNWFLSQFMVYNIYLKYISNLASFDWGKSKETIDII